jgi:hypothetical protein
MWLLYSTPDSAAIQGIVDGHEESTSDADAVLARRQQQVPLVLRNLIVKTLTVDRHCSAMMFVH